MANSWVRSYIDSPQKVWVRRAVFQVHLWIGLFVALYIALIGITGSILVFRHEIEAWGRPAALRAHWDGAEPLGFAGALERMAKEAPDRKLTFMYAPKPEQPAYVGLLQGPGGAGRIALDPRDGTVLEREAPGANAFLRLVGQFHYFLLLDRNPGLMLNGIGGALLLVLTVSGLVIWWPGIRAWKRGFVIDFSRSWKRINFDSHNVIGFWTLAIVSFWAVSGVYFAWPREFMSVFTRFSPLSSELQRFTIPKAKPGTPRAPIAPMLNEAARMAPGRSIAAASLSPAGTTPVILYFSRTPSRSLLEADYYYFDPYSGRYLGLWQRGLTNTFSDWVLWSMAPVHFGTQWGLAVKVVWALLGLALPLLVFTGVLMYWNRYLGKKWKLLISPRVAAGRPAAVTANESL